MKGVRAEAVAINTFFMMKIMTDKNIIILVI